MSNFVQPHRWQPTRLPHPWDPPGKNTGVGCHFLLQCMKVKIESEGAQSCLIPSDPMDHRLPGCSSHRIFQARVMEWGAIAFSFHPHTYWLFVGRGGRFPVLKSSSVVSSLCFCPHRHHSGLVDAIGLCFIVQRIPYLQAFIFDV